MLRYTTRDSVQREVLDQAKRPNGQEDLFYLVLECLLGSDSSHQHREPPPVPRDTNNTSVT